MKIKELKKVVAEFDFAALYKNADEARSRYFLAIEEYERTFGSDTDAVVLSVPGRSELLGNHTDHNGGKVLAGAIDRDVIAVVSKTDDGVITVKSEGYPVEVISADDVSYKDKFENFTSKALIAGVADGILKAGGKIGGCRAYITSDVPKGSGISSSAAYEVMIGNIFNHLYNGGELVNTELAKISQYSENVYFGKPSGLMDQMACAVGGFVYIDFADKNAPVIRPISFSLADAGYELCIVNTGGNHADLNDDYASVPSEMRAVASVLGRNILSGTGEDELLQRVCDVREKCGDRALLRALHFVRENKRVECGAAAISGGDTKAFFSEVLASGRSSFQYLQNVYTNKNVKEQGLSLALALTEGFGDAVGAFRVHGGGFAGTIQAYVKTDSVDSYVKLMNSVFGDGSVMRLTVRSVGAIRVI